MHEPASESLRSKLEESQPLSCACSKTHPTGARVQRSRRTLSRFRLGFSVLKWPGNESTVQTGFKIRREGPRASLGPCRGRQTDPTVNTSTEKGKTKTRSAICYLLAALFRIWQHAVTRCPQECHACLPLLVSCSSVCLSQTALINTALLGCTIKAPFTRACSLAKHKQPAQENY